MDAKMCIEICDQLEKAVTEHDSQLKFANEANRKDYMTGEALINFREELHTALLNLVLGLFRKGGGSWQ